MENYYEKELKELLSENSLSVEKRANTEFNSTEQKIIEHGIVLFGSGLFGQKILKGLREIGIEPIGFCDNNDKLWNTKKEGLVIYSPEEVTRNFPKAIYMVTIWSDVIGHPVNEVEQKLNNYIKVEVISFFFLFWKYPKTFMPYFSIDSPLKTILEAADILECFYLFEDDESRKEYVAQIRWRLTGDYFGLTSPSTYTQYFHTDLFKLNENEVFVDCGAFDGDTIKNFLRLQNNVFKKYIALEPDPINFKKLNDVIEGLPVVTKNKVVSKCCAVSDKKKVISFSSDGSLQSVISETGNIKVNCISIDESFADDIITFIKMDTEGAEPEIIIGAENTIKKHNPILAVSVYHSYNHLWTLPIAIKQLSDNYRFFLRPHCRASWDLICYAIPKNRVL